MAYELLVLAYQAMPFVLAVVLALTLAGVGGAVLDRPLVPLLAYLALYAVFAQSDYGSLDVFLSNPIYARGSGQLFYPALLWFLLVMMGWAWIGRRFSGGVAPPATAVQTALWGWVLLLLLHAAVALLVEVPLERALDSQGFAQMAWMLPLVVLLRWSGQRPEAAPWLLRGLVLAALGKAAFGLVRWAFFGGDPSNVYRNFDHIDVRLTYFDLCDSLVCLLGGVAAVTQLTDPATRRATAWRLLCGLTLLLAVPCILLSYRRTAWGGLALAVAALAWLSGRRWRWPLLLGVLPALLLVLAWVGAQRIGAQTRLGGASAWLFDLMGSRFGAESARVLELQLAWASFTDSPWVGLGAWGRYAYSHLIPWQTSVTAGNFLHSGVLHLALKTGVVGLLLLLALALAFGRECRRALRLDVPARRAVALVALCGVLFLLPDLFIGTPVPQLRTMQFWALCLGLPGLATAATASAARPVPQLAPRARSRVPA